MTTSIKFHEKNVAALGAIESTYGTYVAPAATAVLAATTLEGSLTYVTGAYQYTGSYLLRDEVTYLQDYYSEFSIETPQQVVVTLNNALTPSNWLLYPWFTAVGGTVTVDGSSGAITVSNSGGVAASSISIDYRKTSSQDTVNQKLLRFTGVYGTVDVSAKIKEIPTLKFNFKGNANVPEQNTLITPNYGSQKVNVANSVLPQNIALAAITPWGENFNARSAISGTPSITKSGTTATVTLTSHGLTTGRKVRVSGATGVDGAFYNGDFVITVIDANSFSYTMQGTPASNAAGTLVVSKDGYSQAFCFNDLTASNFFGFDIVRYITGCESGWAIQVMPTDVSVSFLEPQANRYAISAITNGGSGSIITVTSNGHGFSVGDSATVSGVTGADAATYNGTFLVASSSTNTFTYQASAVPAGAGTVTTGSTYADNNTQANFNPDANIMNFFSVKVKIGNKTGRYITYSWDKLQLTQVKDGKIEPFRAKDCTFRNTGYSSMTFE